MFPAVLAVPTGPVREHRAGAGREPGVVLHMPVSASPNPGHTEGSFAGGSGGSLRRFLGESEFSLRERFESSLPEQISHFSSGPDPLVSFGVHWDALTIAAFSEAVGKGLWPRAQPRAAVFSSCFPNNTLKGLKTSLRVGEYLQSSGCVFSPASQAASHGPAFLHPFPSS